MSGKTLEGLDHLKCPSAQFYDRLLMLPKLKKRMKSSGVIIIILSENSLHMSHYGRINSHVVFTKDLHQYLVYKDFHQIFVVGGNFGTVEDNGYSGFDDNILPDAGVDSILGWYQGS